MRAASEFRASASRTMCAGAAWTCRRLAPHRERGCRLLKAGASALSRWWLALAGESTRLRTGLAIE